MSHTRYGAPGAVEDRQPTISTRAFHLEVFRHICADCGAEFQTLADPNAYGTFVYESARGELRFIDGDSDPVWNETQALLEELTGRRATGLDEAEQFHRVLPETFDPPVPRPYWS